MAQPKCGSCGKDAGFRIVEKVLDPGQIPVRFVCCEVCNVVAGTAERVAILSSLSLIQRTLEAIAKKLDVETPQN